MTLWTIQTSPAWNGPRSRPDLRCGGHLAKGEEGVNLELECSADRLLSDFSLWYEPEIAEPFGKKSIQATVWEITIDHVVECRRFTAR